MQMTRSELLELHQRTSFICQGIMKAKNHDYAGDDGLSPFANFERAELLGLCSREVGLMIRVMDKISRITTFLNDGKLLVQNEGLEDAIHDIINYMILLKGMYLERKISQLPEPGKQETTTEDSR